MSRKLFVPGDAAAVCVGADEIARRLVEAAHGLGIDVVLIRNGSRGAHFLEPLIEVETPNGRIGYGPVAPEDVAGLVEAGVFDGAEHALCIGRPEDHPFLKGQVRSTFALCEIVDPCSEADYAAHGGWTGLKAALAMPPQQRVDTVKASGLRGRGGAGFPTGIKWETVFKADGDEKFVVCNADEGDSGTFADRMIMEGDPFVVIEGMTIAGITVGASKGYIYIRSEYPHAVEAMNAAITAARRAGLLGKSIGGSPHEFDLEVRVGAGAYVCGEETSLLESLEGRRGIVRAKPPIPALEGFLGKPTVVNNVLSLATVPWIMANGAEAYAAYGLGRSRGTMPLQIAGNVRHGGLYEVAFGLTLGEIVEGIGGGTASGRPVKAVQVGGPLGAYFPPGLFDTPFGYEEFAGQEGLVGHAGIVVFDDTADMRALDELEAAALAPPAAPRPCRPARARRPPRSPRSARPARRPPRNA